MKDLKELLEASLLGDIEGTIAAADEHLNMNLKSDLKELLTASNRKEYDIAWEKIYNSVSTNGKNPAVAGLKTKKTTIMAIPKVLYIGLGTRDIYGQSIDNGCIVIGTDRKTIRITCVNDVIHISYQKYGFDEISLRSMDLIMTLPNEFIDDAKKLLKKYSKL